ncbi:MAG: hypothetical protein IT423_09985, partial [Pirellulaceae bacterium]|nr:hypothetical protein [Pirellulaceae bacterium]
MQSHWVSRIADWIVDHPRWNILLLVLVTFFAGMGYYDPQWLVTRPLQDADKANNRFQ